jgi:hypothetical protein
VGEKESEPFQFTFNAFLKVAFQGSRVTSDAGVILVRELDERLGLEAIMAEHLSDSRHGLNTQFRLPDLLRQSIDSRLAGYEDLNDAQRLSTDPTCRLIGSPTRWDRNAALTSTLHWFETELRQNPCRSSPDFRPRFIADRELNPQRSEPTDCDLAPKDLDPVPAKALAAHCLRDGRALLTRTRRSIQ